MAKDQSPARGGDDEEPAGSGPSPAGGSWEDGSGGWRCRAEFAAGELGVTWQSAAEQMAYVSQVAAPAAAHLRRPGRRADVRRFREQSGNGGMIARELPADEVLASWQHVEQRALELRSAGVPGSLQELRVRAYLDLLQERDSRNASANPGTTQADGPAGPGTRCEPDGSRDEDTRSGENGGNGGPGPSPGGGATTGGTTSTSARDTGPSLAALVNITVPLGTLLGRSGTPGEAGGFGLLDADTARDLVAAAARDPRTRWCVTALHPDGTAAAHGCAPGRHHPPQPADRHHPPPPGGIGPPGPAPSCESAAEFVSGLKIKFHPVIRGPCDHHQSEDGYRPSRMLQHLVRARTTRCAAPGCRQPAERCDLDHTSAWHDGGRTCPCDLAP